MEPNIIANDRHPGLRQKTATHAITPTRPHLRNSMPPNGIAEKRQPPILATTGISPPPKDMTRIGVRTSSRPAPADRDYRTTAQQGAVAKRRLRLTKTHP
ncbi:hypothetical protein NQK81_40490 [Amycolatopsis roodepoortensis]|uniref:hypothetical protein n=1 Tax=Amycolatopsis roodepoortensis TaxID=700274 RepID=UPI00214C452F|nr:hypothetical protein [Amycolatopsis roodepoortensis]UUV30971.1 hypothetical protein NQK81_40490 [Amycolatopsis roodepoortensis]